MQCKRLANPLAHPLAHPLANRLAGRAATLASCLALALAALVLPGAARAESEASLRSAVFVEHAMPARGLSARRIEPAGRLSRGQKLVLVVDWQSHRKAANFTVTTPIPAPLAYQRSSSDSEQVSVDGGRSWGRLGQLPVRDEYGARLAAPEDVTHVRWRLRGGPSRGRIAYSALVR